MLISRAVKSRTRRWRRQTAPTAAALILGFLSACGGDSPSGPSTTPPATTYEVVGIVFYDENGNGQMDSAEAVRLPSVTVEVGGRTGTSERGSGRVSVTGVAAGNQTMSIRATSLPAYYRAGQGVAVTVPQAAGNDVRLPVTLTLGRNRANVYMEFGDSITDGDGSSDGDGYRRLLEQRLAPYFNRANVLQNGVGATNSAEGALRLPRNIANFTPAYTLILYGTNDWNSSACNSSISNCFTGSAIQSMIRSAKDVNNLPVVSTIIPANTGFDARVPPDRNIRVQQQNEQIRMVCQSEGVPVAESYNAFIQAAGGNLSSLFVDHVHPNDRGHDLIAQSFFEAITRAAGSSSGLGFDVGEPPLVGFAQPVAPRRGTARPAAAPVDLDEPGSAAEAAAGDHARVRLRRSVVER